MASAIVTGMRASPALLLLAPALLAGAGVCQRTWVVDQFGTGHFRDIQSAVAAASPGDSILVWGVGPYDFTVTIDKALAIISQVYGRFARGTLTIANLPAGHTVTVKNFGHFDGDTFRCEVRDCAGLVVLQQLSLDGRSGSTSSPGIDVRRSASVSLRDVQVLGNPAGVIRESHVVVQAGRFVAHDAALVGSAPLHALDIDGSSVAITGVYRGGSGSAPWPAGGDGLRAAGCRLRLLAASFTAGSSHAGPPPYALSATTSDLEVNDTPSLAVRFLGAVETSTSVVRRRGFPWISNDGWTQLAPLTIGVESVPGSLVGVFAGIPATPYRVPEGELWLQPSPLVLVYVGVMTTGSVRVQLPLPVNLPWGLTFGLQAAALTDQGLTLSPPAFPIFEPGTS